MNTPHLDDTLPTSMKSESGKGEDSTRPVQVYQAGDDGPPPPQAPAQTSPGTGRNRRTWISFLIIGMLTLLTIAGMSAFGGYRSGMYERTRIESTQVAQLVQEQFNMGVADMDAGRYDLARQRFEWVIQQDPGYPNVTEMLALVLLEQNTTATSTPAPTPTLIPTPDLRSVEELYTQSKQLLLNGDWSAAIDSLLKLRKDAPEMNPIEVDGMLYVALRNRGVDKIKNADLEGGTYDLALAERFGPLDAEANNYRTWSELYVTGASFWEVDWGKSVEYFEQLILTAPYLMDGSGWTSTDRYRIALAKYGDFLAGQGMYCEAYERYQASRQIREDPAMEPTATFLFDQCNAPAEPAPVEETLTPTPTLEGEFAPTLESTTPVPTLEATQAVPTTEATQSPPAEEPTEEPTTTTPEG